MKVLLLFGVALTAWAQCTQYIPRIGGGAGGSLDCANHSSSPQWTRYRVTLTAGGWTVSKNGATAGAAVTAEADTSQDIVLFSKAARERVEPPVIVKTATACAGATTINLGVGVASSGVLFRAANYDLKAAVSSTNFSTGTADTNQNGGTTFAAENVTARVATTVENVNAITAGCAFDVMVLTAILP